MQKLKPGTLFSTLHEEMLLYLSKDKSGYALVYDVVNARYYERAWKPGEIQLYLSDDKFGWELLYEPD